MKRDRNAILLIQSLLHCVFGQSDKLYFWHDTELRGIDA
jgi:hypothetical protein